MSTTTLFVELLIIGFETCIWLVLLISSFVDIPRSCNLFKKDYATLVTAVTLAVAYVLGIVVDKFSKWIVDDSPFCHIFFRKRTTDRKTKSPRNGYHREVGRMYAYVVVHHGDPVSELLYVRSKVRILRSSTFIVPLIILFGVGSLVRQNDLEFYWWFVGGLALVIGFVLLRAAYLYNEWLYRTRLRHLFEITKEKESRERETE